MSRIWTWVWGKFLLEAEEVPGRPLAFRVFCEAPLPANQPGLFQLVEVGVEAGAGDFGIGRQLVLRWETPVIRVMPVAEMPEDELGRRRPREMMPENKEHFGRLLKQFISLHPFSPALFPEDAQENP